MGIETGDQETGVLAKGKGQEFKTPRTLELDRLSLRAHEPNESPSDSSSAYFLSELARLKKKHEPSPSREFFFPTQQMESKQTCLRSIVRPNFRTN